MATFSVTEIELGPGNQFVSTLIANETIANGEVLFTDTDGELNKADNTDSGKDFISGIALQDATALGSCAVVTQGVIVVTNTLIVGDVLILSTAGDLQIATDLASGGFLSIFGAATGINEITLGITNFGVAKA